MAKNPDCTVGPAMLQTMIHQPIQITGSVRKASGYNCFHAPERIQVQTLEQGHVQC